MSKLEIEQHSFTSTIVEILKKHFTEYAEDILSASPILGYLNIKTRAADKDSKARGAFANHYALYVLIEDYIKKGYANGKAELPYSKYEGARFSELFIRQRELAFGAKLQNHALNGRLNDEFNKLYRTVGKSPIVRDETQHYWIQEDLLLVTIKCKDGEDRTFNIANAVIDIINAYVASKKASFEKFLETCRNIADLGIEDSAKAIEFVVQQLALNVDARVFEIVSYAVLKTKYGKETVWIGNTKDTVAQHNLVLYKTGRTNANDGGIDFVMKPLGKFFQVTETIDVNKYFLDIDKVQRFPITFVIKSSDTDKQIRAAIREQAIKKYKTDKIVDSYMSSIEEIINVEDLITYFKDVVKSGLLPKVMEEIVTQSKVEFNYSELVEADKLPKFNENTEKQDSIRDDSLLGLQISYVD